MNLKRWLKKKFMPTRRCRACGRRLTTAKDRAAGIGGGCLRKEQAAAKAQGGAH